jgi:hypothetical protein
MLQLHRVIYPENKDIYQVAHGWMREQPELYDQDIGYDGLHEFGQPPLERIDFALRQDGVLIGFAYFVLKAPKICEFGLITPPRPRVRSMFALLYKLQDAYFDDLGFLALYAEYPDDPRYDRPRRLCRMFGWREPRSNYFEYAILDHLQAKYGNQENAAQAGRQSAGAV